MSIESMKNMVVLRNLPSNIVEEAIVILKPNIKLKNLDLAENKTTNKKSENKTKQDSKKYIVNEAEMIVSNYLSSIEKEKKYNYKVNKKIENKYKRARGIAIFLGIMLLVTFLIK
ncbi:MAG: hypothetical protein U0M00_03905 [Clostridia bacterium]|mgnify:FL=1|jgi:hypothetical protein|nr:hypothetical protein [Clostridia bacterium]